MQILDYSEPEQLFSNPACIKTEYHKLVMRWHPDHCKEANASMIFQKISELYKQAQIKIANGLWQIPNQLMITDISGTSYKLRFLKHRTFELGDIYIGETKITFCIDKKNEDLFKMGVNAINGLKYANSNMESQFKTCFPKIVKKIETADKHVLLIEKNADEIILRDLFEHLNRLDPKHVAWVISRCLNFACYLRYANLVHSGFNLDTILVSPESHKASLLGGWWYSTTRGQKLVAVPQFTLQYTPSDIIRAKLSDPKIDLESIRALGRALLGDPRGFNMHPDTPAAMRNWLLVPSSGDAIKDFEAWPKILESSFGARRFVELDVKVSDIYPKEK